MAVVEVVWKALTGALLAVDHGDHRERKSTVVVYDGALTHLFLDSIFNKPLVVENVARPAELVVMMITLWPMIILRCSKCLWFLHSAILTRVTCKARQSSTW